MIRVAAILMLVISAGAGGAFAQMPHVGPTWTSDRVRATRPAAPEPALAFDVRQVTTAADAPPKVETSHVLLAPDFTYIVNGKTHTLDDFRLGRTFTWSDGAETFVSVDGHALPAFRVLELANRKTIQAILERVQSTTGKTIGASDNGPYWREAELGVTDASDAPLTPHRTASGTDFLLGGEPVVRMQDQAVGLAEADRKPLTRYLALHLPLHPQVRHALAGADVLPARMEIDAYLLNKKEIIAFAFSGATRTRADYPLPAALQPDVEGVLGAAGTASAPGVQAVVQTIDGRFGKSKPTPVEIIAALRKAAADGHPMEVWLWFNAYLQQYGYMLKAADGPALIETLKPLIRTALQDPEVARFAAVSALSANTQGGSEDRQEAARYLASLKALDALPFGTFRYVTFANLVVGAKDAGKWGKAIFASMPSPLVANYWTHIAAYPWSANVYKDAGDAYFRNFDTPRAWTAFDLGRAVDPDWRYSTLQSVASYEATLEANQPDFF